MSLLIGLQAQAATINVPADQATIQAAIGVANSGDVINLADGTYTEDIIFYNNLAVQDNNITLQGSSPANVTIAAANTTPANSPAGRRGVIGLLSGAFGAGAVSEHKGIIVEGNNITLRNLTIQNTSLTGDPLFGESSAICLMGDNLTIDNCILEAAPNNDVGRCLYVITGDWAAANPAFGALYPSPGFSALNLTVTDTVFRYGDSTIDTVDAAWYLFVAGFVPNQPPIRVGTGSFTNCEVTAGSTASGAIGEIDGGNYSFIDCHFHDFNDGMESGGGTWNFVNCVFERSHNEYCARTNWSGEGGVTQTNFTFTDSIFCGHSSSGMIRMQEGDAMISGCIFNVTDTDSRPVVRYSPGDYDSDWALFGYPTSSNVTIDHCDFYNPNGTGVLGDDPQNTPGEPVGNLIVTNSIFVCATPINLTGAAGIAARNATVTNNDLYTTGTVANPDAGWVVTASSNLNEDPQYNAAGVCPDPGNKILYQYTNTNLATASTTSGSIGSQGVPGAAASGVGNWEVYK